MEIDGRVVAPVYDALDRHDCRGAIKLANAILAKANRPDADATVQYLRVACGT
jgi:hypothetical protein